MNPFGFIAAAGLNSSGKLQRVVDRELGQIAPLRVSLVPPDGVSVVPGLFLGFFSGLTIGGWLVWACEWDRILACIGTTGIPAAGRTKTGIGAPGKSGYAAFAL